MNPYCSCQGLNSIHLASDGLSPSQIQLYSSFLGTGAASHKANGTDIWVEEGRACQISSVAAKMLIHLEAEGRDVGESTHTWVRWPQPHGANERHDGSVLMWCLGSMGRPVQWRCKWSSYNLILTVLTQILLISCETMSCCVSRLILNL